MKALNGEQICTYKNVRLRKLKYQQHQIILDISNQQIKPISRKYKTMHIVMTFGQYLISNKLN